MKLAQRNYYCKSLEYLGKTREDVVVLDADLASSTKTSDFLDAAPNSS